MRAVARGAVLALATGLLDLPLAAQVGWEPPRPPCELVSGNSKIDKGMQVLRGAVEKPDQAKKALGEAITQDNQSTNPAAWYYLGRYYVIVGDVAGADTALSRAATLAPKCAEDIATYRGELLSKLLNDGLSAWQDGKQDSALGLLQVAARLDPRNPKAFATVAALYASRSNDDSALAYYRLAARTAGDAAAFANDRREALTNAWHLVVRKVQGHPAAQRAARVRASLDSIRRGITSDSTVLARLMASSQSRKARDAKLAPADQKLFTRDSTARAEAVARQRAALAAAVQQLAADSSALTAAFAPAIDALKERLAAYPGELDAATTLATLYGQSGHAAQAAAVFDSLVVHSKDLDPDALFGPGTRMVGQGLYGPAARALTLGLAKNPYRRDALFSLAVAYYPLHVTFEFLDPAGQLIATQTQDVPAMSPRQSQAFDLKVSGRRVAGWRYRAS